MIRIAASEYPASPAWKKGASKRGTSAVTRGSIVCSRATARVSIVSAPGAIAGAGGVALLLWQPIAASIGSMRGKLLLAFCGAVILGGCASLDELAGNSLAEPGPAYPQETGQSAVLDIQAFRRETELLLTNTTAEPFPGGGRIWVNAQFSYPFDSFEIGQTLLLDLREFVNEFGERFRAGGFFATELPDDVVLVQIEHGGRIDGVVVVRNEAQ